MTNLEIHRARVRAKLRVSAAKGAVCKHLGREVSSVKVACGGNANQKVPVCECPKKGRCLSGIVDMKKWATMVPENSMYTVCVGCAEFLSDYDPDAAGLLLFGNNSVGN